MMKEKLYELLKRIGYKTAIDKNPEKGEGPTFLDFALTLEDGVIVSKVTTEPEKYSGFVCE